MARRYLPWVVLTVVVLPLAGLGLWLLRLPPAPTTALAPAITPDEYTAMLAALRPPKRERPLVAVIGLNDATETTDYLMPAGILRRADVTDVVMLSTGPGPVQLYPALTVEADATVTEFDAEHPEGADFVIVPAMSRDDDPIAIAWLQDQARKGATIIGVCAGAKVVGAAGLLDGKRATTHWYYLDDLLERNPDITYVADRRMVADQGVVTTTGITASMPMMLTLIEAIAGRDTAVGVARDLGLPHWDARHTSGAFKLTRPFATTVLANRIAFWNRDEVGITLRAGIDEVSLALMADAWSRTYRSRALTVAPSVDAVETRGALRIVPDLVREHRSADSVASSFVDQPPAQALDQTLRSIAARYGIRTADMVAMQLEYPRPSRGR